VRNCKHRSNPGETLQAYSLLNDFEAQNLPAIHFSSFFPRFSQTYTGSIRGRVSDPGGLPVPEARVTITEVSTNTVSETTTNEGGDYFGQLPETWRISGRGERAGIQSDRAGANAPRTQSVPYFQHQNGTWAVSETVEVSASTTELNYVSPEIGHVVEAVAARKRSAGGRRIRGAVRRCCWPNSCPALPLPANTNSNINNFSFGGGRPVTNEIMVDGLPTTNPSDQTYTLTPSPDSVEEFKVLTTPFSAEYGHTAAA